MATISFSLDYLTGDDLDFSPEESESLITVPMAAAHAHLSIKLGKGIIMVTWVLNICPHYLKVALSLIDQGPLLLTVGLPLSFSAGLLTGGLCVWPGNSLSLKLNETLVLFPVESISLLVTRPLNLWSPEFQEREAQIPQVGTLLLLVHGF